MAESTLQVCLPFPRLANLSVNNFFQDRLREHAEAFDGLLSLIPAKYYYAEDTSVCEKFTLDSIASATMLIAIIPI